MMDMEAHNQYLYTLIANNGGYRLKTKKEKSRMVTEYCRVTGQHRGSPCRCLRPGFSYFQTPAHDSSVERSFSDGEHLYLPMEFGEFRFNTLTLFPKECAFLCCATFSLASSWRDCVRPG